MFNVNLDLSSDEVVEMLQAIALIEVYCPDKAQSARNKLSIALRDSVTEIDHEEFQKAIDRVFKPNN